MLRKAKSARTIAAIAIITGASILQAGAVPVLMAKRPDLEAEQSQLRPPQIAGLCARLPPSTRSHYCRKLCKIWPASTSAVVLAWASRRSRMAPPDAAAAAWSSFGPPLHSRRLDSLSREGLAETHLPYKVCTAKSVHRADQCSRPRALGLASSI